MKFIAHTRNENGVEHDLSAHLQGVAAFMASFSVDSKLVELFRVTGLLHDFGKFQMEFQKYLKEGGRKGSVPHASLGAALALHYKLYESAFAIDGHHKGLPDKADLKGDCEEFSEINYTVLNSIKNVFLNDLQIQEKDIAYNPIQCCPGEREVLIRYLFSALTDSDWLDTEKHFNSRTAVQRFSPIINPDLLIDRLERDIRGKNKDGYINQLRNKVREYAILKSQGQPCFYSMNLPTGMGKTLASLSWALHHAKYNNLKRVIIVLPYVSIIDQTAKELKRIFGEEWVLEHHSSYSDDEENYKEIANEAIGGGKYVKRLATENWDYPIIVTTTVQFFESLFGNKPSRCRKVHNIGKSVVIFDEVQTLPKELVLPTLSMLRDVNNVMRTSFLFCTATQPAFEKTDKFNGLEKIIPLVENPKEVFNATRRVNYFPVNHYMPVDITGLANLIVNDDISVLCIFNTKKQALLFYKEICQKEGFLPFHLSTNMYPAHRMRVIEQIRRCLYNKERIIVASTQLIEAGVDFDFPCVYREMAPLESLIQSAGRCNREGKMGNPGKVYIFKLTEATGPDQQYRSLAEFAISLYSNKEELLLEHDFFKEYYRKAVNLFVDPDKKKIDNDRKEFNFKTVADKYKLIENKTTPVFILCDESREVYEGIRYKPILSRDDFRAMQQYSVQVYDNFLKDQNYRLGYEPQGYWCWHGEYSNEYGISAENPLLIM